MPLGTALGMERLGVLEWGGWFGLRGMWVELAAAAAATAAAAVWLHHAPVGPSSVAAVAAAAAAASFLHA